MNDLLNVVGEPVVTVIRNKSGQIFMARQNGNHFDLSQYIGQSFYTESQLQAAYAKGQKEPLALWMIANGLSTGHADTFEELLNELGAQLNELRQQAKQMQADGWRQCAKGQGESQYCGMLEAEKAKAYRKGQEDMRERAANACMNERVEAEVTKQPEDYAYNVACIHCDEAIRALPIEGEQSA